MFENPPQPYYPSHTYAIKLNGMPVYKLGMGSAHPFSYFREEIKPLRLLVETESSDIKISTTGWVYGYEFVYCEDYEALQLFLLLYSGYKIDNMELEYKIHKFDDRQNV